MGWVECSGVSWRVEAGIDAGLTLGVVVLNKEITRFWGDNGEVMSSEGFCERYPY